MIVVDHQTTQALLLNPLLLSLLLSVIDSDLLLHRLGDATNLTSNIAMELSSER